MNRATGRLPLAALLLALLLSGAPAAAHPVDELVQTAYITLTPERVELELDLTPGSEVAGPLIAALDADGDGAASDAEARAYAEGVLALSTLTLNGSDAPWALYDVAAPPLDDLRAGAGAIRIYALAVGGQAPGAHVLEYANAYAPADSQWTANIFLNPGEGRAYDVTGQERSDEGRGLTVAYVVR